MNELEKPMKDFLDIRIEEQAFIYETSEKLYEAFKENPDLLIEMKEEIYQLLEDAGINTDELNEGIVGKLVGGIAGFAFGPKFGRIIAKALGIEKGILYDMFNSRLVGAALGSAVAKAMGA